jgi:hypothetical protein
MKIRPVGAEFFHADRGTDMTGLIVVAFRNFAKARKTRREGFWLEYQWHALVVTLITLRVS